MYMYGGLVQMNIALRKELMAYACAYLCLSRPAASTTAVRCGALATLKCPAGNRNRPSCASIKDTTGPTISALLAIVFRASHVVLRSRAP